MEEPAPGSRVRVLSTKYDGSLHNDFVAHVIEGAPGNDGTGAAAGPAPLRLFVPAGTPIRSYRGDLEVRIPFTALFWPDLDCWWNVYHNHWTLPRDDQRWTPESYANVCTPATFDGETVRWVDLDLDVTIRLGTVELLDEDEFEEHRARWGYPEPLVARARRAASELMHLAARRAPPFDRQVHVPGTREA